MSLRKFLQILSSSKYREAFTSSIDTSTADHWSSRQTITRRPSQIYANSRRYIGQTFGRSDGKKISKLLKSLALPKGFEPLFSPGEGERAFKYCGRSWHPTYSAVQSPDARRTDWTSSPNGAVICVRAGHGAPAPPAKGHRGLVLVTSDAVEAKIMCGTQPAAFSAYSA